MELRLKEKRFTIRDSFTIEDKKGKDRFEVIGEFIEATKKLHIKNMKGKEVAMIKEKLISFEPKYSLYVNDKKIGELERDEALFGDKYYISDLDWKIKGDDDDYDYKIMDGWKKIATIRKKFIALSNTYILDIEDEKQEIPVVAALLAILCMIEQEKEKK